MKILSLWQPWATLVATGAKRNETRSWETGYRGPIAIHASKKWDRTLARLCYQPPFQGILVEAGYEVWSRSNYGQPIFDGRKLRTFGLSFGTIVAIVDLVGCVPTLALFGDGHPWHPSTTEMAFGDYSRDRYVWRLANVRKLPEPIRVRGCQGLRDLPAGVSALIDNQSSVT